MPGFFYVPWVFSARVDRHGRQVDRHRNGKIMSWKLAWM
jgi:hypothetical protein